MTAANARRSPIILTINNTCNFIEFYGSTVGLCNIAPVVVLMPIANYFDGGTIRPRGNVRNIQSRNVFEACVSNARVADAVITHTSSYAHTYTYAHQCILTYTH